MRCSFIYVTAILLLCSACTTVNVDHIQRKPSFDVQGGDTIVLLGRRHKAGVETEFSLVNCMARYIDNRIKKINVLSESKFIDAFYPWFEPRTAPLHPKKLRQLLDSALVKQKMAQYKIRYFIWASGSTETTDSAGSMSCSISPGGAGCFGFGMWEDTSDYELAVWDLKETQEVGRISTEAVGTSYVPAFFVPIPLLAGVEKDACVGMSKQLINFFEEKK